MSQKVEYAPRIRNQVKTENILIYVKNDLLFVLDVDNIYIERDCLYSNEKTIKAYLNTHDSSQEENLKQE